MILIRNGSEYPLFVGDLQLSNPDWAVGNPLPQGWDQVEESDRPNIFAKQKYVEKFPEMVGPVWKRVWSVVNMTDEELVAVSTIEIPNFKPTL